jgi:uncharacterized membrane protein YbhN (UPF0104 family)
MVRLTVAAVVAWCVWYTVEKAVLSLRAEEFSLAELKQLDPAWLVAAAGLYVAGLLPACWFWRKVLHAMGQEPPAGPLLRAYFIGHLGKYVPGKAMVLVIRAGLLRGAAVDATVAAVSVFVETLTFMAVGGCLAAVLLAVHFGLAGLSGQRLGLVGLGLLFAIASGIPTLPPIFRRVVMALQVKRLNPQIEHAVAGLDWRLTLWGWVLISVTWCLMGLSLAAVLQAIPGVALRGADLPLLIATAALAMVAGFVSFMPGGLGVREVVVIPILAPVFGTAPAIVSAIVLRLIWLFAELAASAVVYLIPAGQTASEPESSRRQDACAT